MAGHDAQLKRLDQTIRDIAMRQPPLSNWRPLNTNAFESNSPENRIWPRQLRLAEPSLLWPYESSNGSLRGFTEPGVSITRAQMKSTWPRWRRVMASYGLASFLAPLWIVVIAVQLRGCASCRSRERGVGVAAC